MKLKKRLNLLNRLAEAKPEYFDYLRGRLDKEINNAEVTDEDGSEEAQRKETERAERIEQRRQEWLERRRIKAGNEVAEAG